MKNLFLIAFLVILFFGVIFTVLTNMGGNSDTLKSSVAAYISEALQGKTTIATLNDMQYFPKVIVDFEGAEVTREGITDPVFKIGSMQIAMDFWNISTGNAQLSVLNAKDIYAQAGIISKKELYFKRLGIVDEKIDDPAFLFLEGKYGGRPFEGRIGMDRVGKTSPYQYKLAEDMTLSLKSAPLSITGRLLREKNRKMIIRDLKILTPAPSLRGKIILQASAKQENLYLEGDLILGENTKLSPDLKITLNTKPITVTGRIESEKFDINDITALTALLREIQNLTSFESANNTKLQNMNWGDLQMDVTLDAKDPALTTQITIQDGKLDLGSLKDKIKQ